MYLRKWYLKKRDDYLFKSRIRWLAKMALKEVLVELGLATTSNNRPRLHLQHKIEPDMPLMHQSVVPLLQVNPAHHLK